MSVPVITDSTAAFSMEMTHPRYWDPPMQDRDDNGNLLLTGQGELFPDALWDSAWLAGYRLPGVCDVKCKATLQIDQQKGPKHDGAILIMHGLLPSPIEIAVKIWTQAQYTWMETILPKFWRPPLKNGPGAEAQSQAAVEFYSPNVPSIFGLKQVIVKGISTYEIGPEPQTRVLRIEAVQFLPPTKKTSPSKVKPPPPKTPGDERLIKLDPPWKTGVNPHG